MLFRLWLIGPPLFDKVSSYLAWCARG